MKAIDHYDDQYFRWQGGHGGFTARAARGNFVPYLSPTDRVVDFGCGGAALLASLPCKDRRGVEVNPAARAEASRNGVVCSEDVSGLEDGWADLVISFHALEHTENPLGELRAMLPKMRPGALAVYCVPHETNGWRYARDDINQHLYTWSPMSLGNLFTVAGFEVASVTVDKMVWPPAYQRVQQMLGDRGFNAFCKIYRWARVLAYPLKPLLADATIRIVARRPRSRLH